MKQACTLGCKDRYGRPEVHASQRLCPIAQGLKQEARSRRGTVAPAPSAPPSGPSAAPPAARSPTPWAITYKPTTAMDPSALNAPIPAPMEWEISVETSERFWQNIFSLIEMVVDFICRAFDIPEVPPGVFELDEGQKFVFRTALRPPTGVFLRKVMGAKSPEQADMIVSGMSGLIGFGQVFVKIGLHFWKHLPESPKWKALKARVGRRGKADGESAPARPQRATGREPAPPAPVEADFTKIVPPTPGAAPAGA